MYCAVCCLQLFRQLYPTSHCPLPFLCLTTNKMILGPLESGDKEHQDKVVSKMGLEGTFPDLRITEQRSAGKRGGWGASK